MKMTCYPNSLDAHTTRSEEPRTEEADGVEIKLILFGDFCSFRDTLTTELHKVCPD